MDDSGEKRQYSKTSIFGRIYQHSTTREQKAFTLNHHHTTTSDNSRLSKNTPRPHVRVLPEQNNTDIRSGAQPSFQLLPEARNQRQRTKNTRNSRLQRRRRIKTFHLTSFLKRRTRRKHRAAGYIAPEFFEDKNLDPPTFASAIPPKKNPDISLSSEATCRETTQMMV